MKADMRLKWIQIYDIEADIDFGPIGSLSWGVGDEILVANSYLRLWSAKDGDTPGSLWKQKLAHPAKLAYFSHNAAYIASMGFYDKVVKIWRRLSYDTEEIRFDTSYLSHPTTATNLHWRKPRHREQNLEQLLYTFCADNKIRIWAAADQHGLTALHLWHIIDMNDVLQPRRVDLSTDRRFGFIIDSRDFAAATEKAVQSFPDNPANDHAMEHLIEVANRSPEICIVLDGQGHMSAWGLENAGSRNKTSASVFNVAHVEGLNISFDSQVSSDEDYTTFTVFSGGTFPDSITLLVHHFDGRIGWYDAKITEFFDTSVNHNRVKQRALWSGHDGPVKKIIRNDRGNAVLSRTDENHGVVWKQIPSHQGPGLLRHSTLLSDKHIHRSTMIRDGDVTALLHHGHISLWDTSSFYARKLEEVAYDISAKPLCLLALPEVNANRSIFHFAVIGADAKGLVWEVNVPFNEPLMNGTHPRVREFCRIDLKIDDDIAFVLPVDPAGSTTTVTGFLDIFALDVALTYSKNGTVRMLTARVDQENEKVEWLVTAKIETGIPNPSLASGSSIRKVALVDEAKTTLTIWDTTGTQLEYQEQFSDVEIIKDLDWTSTPDNQSVLAVGFPHRVLLLSQLRYDYLNAGPAWIALREIRIRDVTPHPIGDSCWLGNGNLVIGAGNQIFIYGQEMEVGSGVVERLGLSSRRPALRQMFEVVRQLNGPLSVFHPQFLSQCILCGKFSLVQMILTTLHRKLKFWSEGDELDSFVGLSPENFVDEQDNNSDQAVKELMASYTNLDLDNQSMVLNEESAADLNDNLARKALPGLTSQEQFHLADIAECAATIEKQKRSMDENAARYLLFFRQHMLGRTQSPSKRVEVSWREIVWAFHSGSQDIIVDMVSRSFSGKLIWNHARETGMFMFLTDITALRTHLETIARNEYTKNDDRSPIDCSLFYLALKKKAVLSGLWRMAQGYKEQGATIKLLANNFNDPRWKTAALKNAYALLSRRRFQYAAAFFLLGDSLLDAVNVCLNQLHDLQLAITIARVYEGDEGPVMQNWLLGRVLQEASMSGNRWLASWAFWMLNRRDRAVRCLITPINTLLDSPGSPGSPGDIPLEAKSYLSNDPALVVLYQQLRQKTLQALKGATMVNPREEWDFIIRNARLYSRMGCDILALDLVKNFEFLRAPLVPRKLSTTTIALQTPTTPDPRRLLRRRSSHVVDDMRSPLSPSPAAIADGDGLLKDYMTSDHGKAPKAKPPPTVFEEPSADSLLDNFGF